MLTATQVTLDLLVSSVQASVFQDDTAIGDEGKKGHRMQIHRTGKGLDVDGRVRNVRRSLCTSYPDYAVVQYGATDPVEPTWP